MNPNLDLLHPYPFQKLRQLFNGVTAADKRAINLSIGEPKHPAPQLVKDALIDNMAGLSAYPTTQGSDSLRQSIADWLAKRYGIATPNPATDILPVNGSREALFAFVQAVIAPRQDAQKPVVISPNPFYQIYEGAALLANAEPYYVNCTAENAFQPDWASIPEAIWERTQLVFVCSPGNPTGAVMSLEDWKGLFALSDRYGFIIASDECYSEIWFDSAPLGALEAAARLGRHNDRIVMFSSLSKRSNVPGMRSGFVAGDKRILENFLLYRTYHGCAMNPGVQAASEKAWQDEVHVEENRKAYRAKFAAVTPILAEVLPVTMPDAAFYLWLSVPGDDAAFARQLFAEENVTVLPGSYLAREAHGVNPGYGYIRIALVAPLAECVEAAQRIAALVRRLKD